MGICAKCEAPVESPGGRPIGRTESCDRCGADLHSCIQCGHYDPSAYNQCRENSAERVVDKERSNFCDYFSLGKEKRSGKADSADTLKKLDDLFK